MNFKYGDSMVEHTSVFHNPMNNYKNIIIQLGDKFQIVSYLINNYKVIIMILTNSVPNRRLIMSTIKDNMLN